MDSPDRELVRAARGKNRDAFAQLTRRNLPSVFAICLAHLGNPSDAEDAVQDTFLQGYRRLGSLEDEDRFRPWITQIARNRCRDLLRQRTRRNEVDRDVDLEPSLAAEAGDHEELHEALRRLPVELRLPLLLYYFEGKDTHAVAEELGLSQGGACKRLYTARAGLRRLLERKAGGHEHAV